MLEPPSLTTTVSWSVICVGLPFCGAPASPGRADAHARPTLQNRFIRITAAGSDAAGQQQGARAAPVPGIDLAAIKTPRPANAVTLRPCPSAAMTWTRSTAQGDPDRDLRRSGRSGPPHDHLGRRRWRRGLRTVVARRYGALVPRGARELGDRHPCRKRRLPACAVPAHDADSVSRTSAELERKYEGDPAAHSMVRDEILVTTLRLDPAGD